MVVHVVAADARLKIAEVRPAGIPDNFDELIVAV